jgi:hypothetical protein
VAVQGRIDRMANVNVRSSAVVAVAATVIG